MTYDEARDEILAIFKRAWDTTGYPATYTDVPVENPGGNGVWARATIRHADGNQATLSNQSGERRYERVGVVFFQIFAPAGDGSKAGYDAAQIVSQAFEGVSSCVWFRNVRLKELGSSGGLEQLQVSATFQYDHIH